MWPRIENVHTFWDLSEPEHSIDDDFINIIPIVRLHAFRRNRFSAIQIFAEHVYL